jgi:hypothetical protein
MRDPRRLLLDQPTDFERSLLESAARERPSEAHRMEVRRALWEVAPRAAAAAAGTKAAIAGLVVTAIVGLVLVQRARSVNDEALESNTLPTAPALVAPIVEIPAPLSGPPASPRAEPAPVAAAPAKVRSEGRSTGRSSIAPSDASDVRDQIRMIDEARAAMSRHEPTSALRTIDRYVARYPDGVFQQEAGILRILALDDRGDRAKASILARSFLASHPTSAHVTRIERIAGR